MSLFEAGLIDSIMTVHSVVGSSPLWHPQLHVSQELQETVDLSWPRISTLPNIN